MVKEEIGTKEDEKKKKEPEEMRTKEQEKEKRGEG